MPGAAVGWRTASGASGTPSAIAKIRMLTCGITRLRTIPAATIAATSARPGSRREIRSTFPVSARRAARFAEGSAVCDSEVESFGRDGPARSALRPRARGVRGRGRRAHAVRGRRRPGAHAVGGDEADRGARAPRRPAAARAGAIRRAADRGRARALPRGARRARGARSARRARRRPRTPTRRSRSRRATRSPATSCPGGSQDSARSAARCASRSRSSTRRACSQPCARGGPSSGSSRASTRSTASSRRC